MIHTNAIIHYDLCKCPQINAAKHLLYSIHLFLVQISYLGILRKHFFYMRYFSLVNWGNSRGVDTFLKKRINT